MAEPRRIPGIAALILLILSGCQSKPPPMNVRQLQHPREIALGCLDLSSESEVQGLPMASCTPVVDEDVVPKGTMVAYITQSDSGDLGVMNVEDNKLFDLDIRVPLYSSMPVGDFPIDVVASPDGRFVYVANYGSADLAVVDVRVFGNPTTTAPPVLPLAGRPASLEITADGQFLFVSEPEEGRIELLSLVGEGCEPGKGLRACSLGTISLRGDLPIPLPAGDGGVPDAGEDASTDAGPDAAGDGGQTKAASRFALDAAADGSPDAAPDASPDASADAGSSGPLAGSQPWHLLLSPRGDLLYVSDIGGRFVLEMDVDKICRIGLEAAGGTIGGAGVVRRVFDVQAPSRRLAVSPRVDEEPWLYVVDDDSGDILVVNLKTGRLVNVNADNPLADSPAIQVPAFVRDVVFVEKRLPDPDSEDYAMGDPSALHGLFAVAASSNGNVYVINVRDERPKGCFIGDKRGGEYNEQFCPRHVLRSGRNIIDPKEGEMPALEDQPILETDAGQLDIPSPQYPTFKGWEPGQTTNGGAPDGGLAVQYGISFNDDPRRALNQDWTVALNGKIPGAGGFGGTVYPDGYFSDVGVPFCDKGVRGAGEDYPGDILLITTKPAPIDPKTDCGDYEKLPLVYLVARAYQDHVELTRAKGGPPLPTRTCFPMAVGYEIRANDEWVVAGTASGFLHDLEADPDGGLCLASGKAIEGKNGRARYNEPFVNYFFEFTILPPTDGKAYLPPNEGYDFRFTTINGFLPLGADSGDMIASMALAPSGMILVVDESGIGIVKVYLNPGGVLVTESNVK